MQQSLQGDSDVPVIDNVNKKKKKKQPEGWHRLARPGGSQTFNLTWEWTAGWLHGIRQPTIKPREPSLKAKSGI